MAHIQKRGPSRYKVRYRGPDGKERSKTFPRKGDADRFAVTVEADRVRGAWVAPERGRRAVSEYADLWLSTLDCKPKTRAGYESILNRWILPAFGSRPVSKVSWSVIERFKADMAEAQKSPQTIKNALNVLRPILGAAVRDGALLKNPVDDVKSSEVRLSSRARFESAETIAALAETMDDASGLHVLFAAFTGLRVGECAALRVSDLDLLRSRVTARESVSEVHGRIVFTTTKNHSARSVAIPPLPLGAPCHSPRTPWRSQGPKGDGLHLPRRIGSEALQLLQESLQTCRQGLRTGWFSIPRPAPHLCRHADPIGGIPEGDHGAPWAFVDQGPSRHLRAPASLRSTRPLQKRQCQDGEIPAIRISSRTSSVPKNPQ